MTIRHATIALTFWALSTAPIEASAPPQISVQGKLTDAAGMPLPAGDQALTFSIFDAPSGGNLLWTENQSIPSDAAGLWSGSLGAQTPLHSLVFADTVRWLEITVMAEDGSFATLPRVRLITGPYAHRVATVDGADGGNITSSVTIGPGHANSGSQSLVAGTENFNTGDWSVIAGGRYDSVTADLAVVAGGLDNEATAEGAVVGGGKWNRASGIRAVVVGGLENHSSGNHAVVGGGAQNNADGLWSKVGGGSANHANGLWSTVGGGVEDTAFDTYSFVGGGFSNSAHGVGAAVAGGGNNHTSGLYPNVAGGWKNFAMADYTSIGGGNENLAGGFAASIVGGQIDTATGNYSHIGGGYHNAASGEGSVITGGANNAAYGLYSFIGGGAGNRTIDYVSTVCGGENDTANGTGAAILGGSGNFAGPFSSVTGGINNRAAASWAHVGGGTSNSVLRDYAAIAGGNSNEAGGQYSAIGGGFDNQARGRAACVPGGKWNSADSTYCLAAGYRASALHPGCFVWGDSSESTLSSTGNNQFLIRASGGVGIGTNAPAAALDIASGKLRMTGGLADVEFTEACDITSYVTTNGPNNGDRAFGIHTALAGVRLFTVLNNGSVGVRVDNPTSILHVLQFTPSDPIADAWTTYSSRRWKKDIRPIKGALDLVSRLEGVRYRWKANEQLDIGLIAEDVGKVIPEVVAYDENGIDANSVDYARLVALLIEGMKEQQRIIEQQNDRITQLEQRLEQ